MLSYAMFGAPAPFDPAARWVTSPLFPPPVLGALRLAAGLYALATLCVVLAVEVSHGQGSRFFSFFTRLTYIGIIAYMFASAVQTLAYSARRGRAKAGYPLQRWPRVLQMLHVILFATVSTFPLVVTAVFWSLLSSPDTLATRYDAWENISVHALNAGFALFEIFCTNAPAVPWAVGLPVELLIGLYLALAYVTHATEGFWTYSFLDPEKQGSLVGAYIVGIALGNVVVFALARTLCALRARLAGTRGLAAPAAPPPQAGSFEAIGEWHDVALGEKRASASARSAAESGASTGEDGKGVLQIGRAV